MLEISDSLSAQDGTIDANGFITLKSTNTLKGRVGMIGATGDIIGNLTVETYASGRIYGLENHSPVVYRVCL